MKEILPMYFPVISALAVWVTLADKQAAKNRDERVPEIWLLLIGLLGGAVAEWVCMKLARHKTRRRTFMIGLPIFMGIHLVVTILLLLKEFV